MKKVFCTACLFDLTLSDDGGLRFSGARCPKCRQPYAPLVVEEPPLPAHPPAGAARAEEAPDGTSKGPGPSRRI